MPTIRTLYVAVIVILLLAWAGIIYISGYSQSNGLTVNATISAFGNLSTNATPSTGLFAAFGNLSTSVNNTRSGLTGASTASNPITGITTGITVASGFISSLPALVIGIINFIAIPFAFLGLPLGFAQVVAYLIVIGVCAFALLSAIFLFPI